MKPDAPPERTSPLLIGLIVIGGTVLSWLLVQTGPRVTTEEEVKAAKMVKVQELTPKLPDFVAAHGTVIPARRVSIEPELGLILSQHPKLRPGGMIMEGEGSSPSIPRWLRSPWKASAARFRQASTLKKPPDSMRRPCGLHPMP